MRIGMIMHRTLLAWRPNQQQKIEDARDLADEVSRVLFGRIGVYVFGPVGGIRGVGPKEGV